MRSASTITSATYRYRVAVFVPFPHGRGAGVKARLLVAYDGTGFRGFAQNEGCAP